MAFLIDASDATPLNSRDILPKGTYQTVMKNFIVESTQDGGKRIPAQFVICDGPFKGRTVFDDAYIFDPNGKRVNHGKSVLKGISDAFKISPQWTDEVLLSMNGKRIDVTLDVAPSSVRDGRTYQERNRITGFAAPNAAANTAPAPQMMMQPQQPMMTAAPMQPAAAPVPQYPQAAMPPQQSFPAFQPQPMPAAAPLAPATQYAQPAPPPMQPAPASGAPAFMQQAMG